MSSEIMTSVLSGLDILYSWIWGAPLLILLTGIGIYLTIALRGLQFRYLGYALKLVFGSRKAHPEAEGQGDISHFESLMTAWLQQSGLEILPVLQQPLQWVVLVLFFGCGLQPC